MQNIENDMDDLFKRAAENYPLRQEKSDWENIAKKLASVQAPQSAPSSKNNSRKRFFALLGFLILLSISVFLFFNSKPTIHENDLIKDELKKDSQKEIASKNSVNGEQKSGIILPGQNGVTIYTKKRNMYQHSSAGSVTIRTSNASPYNIATNDEEKPKEGYVLTKDGSNITTSREIADVEIQNSENNDRNITENKIKRNPEKTESELNSQLKVADSSISRKKQKPILFKKQRGFYLAPAIGLDFSRVESSAFNSAGFEAGFILGYNFNSKLSLESGLIFNKKNYTSEGKSFSMDKMQSSMPQGMVIDDLQGRSSILEIPVKVKYNFIRNTKSNVFITGGISAYIMTKENNNYNVTLNGNHEKLTGEYEKNDFCLPAVANISAGYEHRIAKDLNIRFEPYLKIPLRGMGVGSLPVTSVGLQFGLIHRL